MKHDIRGRASRCAMSMILLLAMVLGGIAFRPATVAYADPLTPADELAESTPVAQSAELTQKLQDAGFSQQQAAEASEKLLSLVQLVRTDAQALGETDADLNEADHARELVRLLGMRLAQGSTLADEQVGEEGVAQEVLDALSERPTTARALAKVMLLAAEELGIPCEELSLSDASWTWNAVDVDGVWLHVDVAAAVRARQQMAESDEAEPTTPSLYQTDSIPQPDDATKAWLLRTSEELVQADAQREQAVVAFCEAHASDDSPASEDNSETVPDHEPSGQSESVTDETVQTETDVNQGGVPAETEEAATDEAASHEQDTFPSEESVEQEEVSASNEEGEIPAEVQDSPLLIGQTNVGPVTHDLLTMDGADSSHAAEDPAGTPEDLQEDPAGAAAPSEAAGVTAEQAKNYSYTVQPMLAPFNNIIYVKTDNPDPNSFRLVDRGTSYDTSGQTDPGVFKLLDYHFIDVRYEKESTYRVPGGYLFYDYSCCSDGGTLTLQVKGQDGKFTNTSKTVSCATMKDSVDYLIDTYASGTSGFFNKLDAVQDGLNDIAVYPHGTADSTKPSSLTPYPLLAVSPYAELSLNEHFESMYEDVETYQLLDSLYPFVLDSLSFPGTMAGVATRLNPSCTVDNGSNHWEVTVSYGSTTQTYGGAGIGGDDPVLSEWVTTCFTFDGAANDMGTRATLSRLRTIYLGYSSQASDAVSEYGDQLHGEAFSQAIGAGSWIKVQREGFGFGENPVFAYVSTDEWDYSTAVSDVWVDGRYVDRWETWVEGATFSEHPYASILLRNKTYTDYEGETHTGDMLFEYDDNSNTWRAENCYFRDSWYDDEDDLPAAFVLTQSQVAALKPDANTNKTLTSWLIYDGTQPPGTPHTIVHVRGISLPKSISICVDAEYQLVPTFTPKDADFTNCTWTTTNSNVVEVLDDGYLEGKRQGKATVTCKSVDGGYTASCTVTVTRAATDFYTGSMVLTLGQRKKLPYGYAPSDASITFQYLGSGDESVCTIDETGMVTAVGYGHTYIYAQTSNHMYGQSVVYVVPPWKRIAGSNAVGTGKAIVEADGVFKAGRGGTVIVATSDGYRDALAATGLAGRLDAPIVITPGKALANETRAAIERLEPEQILVAGGPVAVSADVFAELEELAPNVERVYGRNAVGTAIALYQAGGDTWSNTAIVATANGFADALSIAPYAYAKGAPIFLTNVSSQSSGRVLSDEALDAIEQGGFTRVIIVGGRVAVDTSVDGALKQRGVKTIKRLSGSNALGTSSSIARWELSSEGMKATHLTIATSGSYKDALCGAALCGKQNSVLVLVDKRGNTTAVEDVFGDKDAWKGIQHGHVLGGAKAVSAEVWELLTQSSMLYWLDW